MRALPLLLMLIMLIMIMKAAETLGATAVLVAAAVLVRPASHTKTRDGDTTGFNKGAREPRAMISSGNKRAPAALGLLLWRHMSRLVVVPSFLWVAQGLVGVRNLLPARRRGGLPPTTVID